MCIYMYIYTYMRDVCVYISMPLDPKSFFVGELILQLYTHQLHNFNCRGINLCNACVSLVSVCVVSIISQKGEHTTKMPGE